MKQLNAAKAAFRDGWGPGAEKYVSNCSQPVDRACGCFFSVIATRNRAMLGLVSTTARSTAGRFLDMPIGQNAMEILVRTEQREDQAAIFDVTKAAFEGKRYADGTEAPIIDQLRHDGDLFISLVACVAGDVVGHVAFSPARIGEASCNWYGLGPVSVSPDVQRRGIGTALITEGLSRLRDQGAAGCLLIGDPNYYGRFGFRGDCGLSYGDTAASNVQALSFSDTLPQGEARFAPAFYKFG